MFGLQLTETPVASGAKGSRGPDMPMAVPGVVKPEFQTYLGKAQTGAAIAAPDTALPSNTGALVASDIAPGQMPIERLSKLSENPAASAEQAGVDAPLTDPADPEAQISAPTAEGLASPDDALQSAPDTFALPEHATPEISRPGHAPEQGQAPTDVNQETVTAQTLSPETEAGTGAEPLALSQTDIPEEGLLPQPDSGIRSEVEQPLHQDVSAQQAPTQTISPEALDQPAEIALPEVLEQPDAASLELPSDMGAPDAPLMAPGVATADQVSLDRILDPGRASNSAAMSSGAEMPSQAQFLAQTVDQPSADGAFSRVLTEVSISVAPSSAPVAQTAQPTLQSPAPAQAQPQPVLDMAQANWAEALVEDVSLQPMGRGDTLTLTLTPERLGTMQVRLEMQDGQTHVHFITETPEAARLLTEAQSRLADLMSRAGVDLGNQSATTGQGSQQNDRSGQPAPAQDMSPEPSAEPNGEIASSSAHPAGASARSTVDVVA